MAVIFLVRKKRKEVGTGILGLEVFGIGWLPSRRPPGLTADDLIELRLDEQTQPNVYQAVLDAVNRYSSSVESEDVIKFGWKLGVEKFDRARSTAKIVEPEALRTYHGLDKDMSIKITEWIWSEIFLNKNLTYDVLVNELASNFSLNTVQAQEIVETEIANIFNKLREWVYERYTEFPLKYIWQTRQDACEKCLTVMKRSRNIRSLTQLKTIILEVGGETSREWAVHSLCRCVLIARRDFEPDF